MNYLTFPDSERLPKVALLPDQIFVPGAVCLELMNSYLIEKICKQTFYNWGKGLSLILESADVRGWVNLGEKTNQKYSLTFLYNLIFYGLIKDQLKQLTDDKHKQTIVQVGACFTETQFNRLVRPKIEEINFRVISKMFEEVDGEWLYPGKNFLSYFALFGIRIGQSSLYIWSAKNPNLPTFACDRNFTHAEFMQWYQFVSTKKDGRGNAANFKKK